MTCVTCGAIIGRVCGHCGVSHNPLSADGLRCAYCHQHGFTNDIFERAMQRIHKAEAIARMN